MIIEIVMYTKKGEMYMEQEKIEQLRKEAMENYRIMRECDKTLRKIKKINDAENGKKGE